MASPDEDDLFETAHISAPQETLSAVNNREKREASLPGYELPSFDRAREHLQNSLPRRVRDEKQPTGFKLALQGQTKGEHGEDTELYDPYCTPSGALDEFGVGIGLYFKSLKALFVVLLVCALISVVAIKENETFNPSSSEVDAYNGLTGGDVDECPVQLLGSVYGAQRDDLHLNRQGASDIAVCCILALFAIFAAMIERYTVEAIDRSNLTTEDYSVEVVNPPKHIDDPQEYYDYFSQFGDVCLVSVIKKSGDICRALGKRKALKDTKSTLLAHGNNETTADLPLWKRVLQNCCGFYPTVDYLDRQISTCTSKVLESKSKDYAPWKVFAIFNRTADQRNCLQRTAVGYYDYYFNTTTNAEARLKGTVLSMRNPVEPSEIIYENSHIGIGKQMFFLLISYGVCAAMMVASFYAIDAIASGANDGDIGVAVFISLVNTILPSIVKQITLSIEIHHNHGEVQQSILVKLVIVRCINSGVLIYIVRSYEDMFGLGNLASVQNILLADAIATPMFRLCNLDGLFQRYVLGFFAQSQVELNSLWSGTEWTLAERYTDVIKTIFVGVFFAVLLPSGLFISAFAMISTYFVDKYSLLRLWKRPPSLNAQLSLVSRYFFVLTVWAHVSVSRVYFARWPYGGLLEEDDGTKPRCSFFRCDITSDMTSTQESIVRIYNIGGIVSFAVILFWAVILNFCVYVYNSVLYGEPDVNDDEGDEDFREHGSNLAYVPTIDIRNGEHVICCDVSGGKVPIKYLPLSQTLREKSSNGREVNIMEICVATLDELNLSASEQSTMDLVLGSVKYYDQKASTKSPAYTGHTTQTTDSITTPALAKPSLPPNWEMRRTPEGRPYYLDHSRGVTQWSAPV